MPIPASPLTLAYLAELQTRHQRELTEALRMCAANDDVDIRTSPHTISATGEWVPVASVNPTPTTA